MVPSILSILSKLPINTFSIGCFYCDIQWMRLKGSQSIIGLFLAASYTLVGIINTEGKKPTHEMNTY